MGHGEFRRVMSGTATTIEVLGTATTSVQLGTAVLSCFAKRMHAAGIYASVLGRRRDMLVLYHCKNQSIHYWTLYDFSFEQSYGYLMSR